MREYATELMRSDEAILGMYHGCMCVCEARRSKDVGCQSDEMTG